MTQINWIRGDADYLTFNVTYSSTGLPFDLTTFDEILFSVKENIDDTGYVFQLYGNSAAPSTGVITVWISQANTSSLSLKDYYSDLQLYSSSSGIKRTAYRGVFNLSYDVSR